MHHIAHKQDSESIANGGKHPSHCHNPDLTQKSFVGCICAKSLGVKQRYFFLQPSSKFLQSRNHRRRDFSSFSTGIRTIFPSETFRTLIDTAWPPTPPNTTMPDLETHSDHLHWTACFGGPDPVWPREPDIDVVRALAKEHLMEELPTTFDDNLLDVSFFAEGGFNKLFLISYTGHHRSYLLRVALPVIPYYKTESEVATIAYLHANTTIPVPRIFAWDSDRDNKLTFEWILMEKMGGVPLWDLWPQKISWERKLELTKTIARMNKQLREHKFDRIGGLYFKSALEHRPMEHSKTVNLSASLQDPSVNEPTQFGSEDNPASTITLASALQDLCLGCRRLPILFKDWHIPFWTAQSTVKEAPKDIEVSSLMGNVGQVGFSMGPIFDHLFFVGSRLHLPGNRGPYESSFEWLSAEIQIQLDWITNGPVNDDVEYEDEFAEESPDMERVCHKFLDILPTIVGNREKEASFVLHHSDLNAANILVDPETFEIMGIVDWEMINVAPEWRAADTPRFLEYMEPDDDEEPLIPSDDIGEDDIAWELRNRWEHKTLRRVFDEITQEASGKEGNLVHDLTKAKAIRDCHGYISELTGEWRWSEKWLTRYKTKGISINRADRALVTYQSDDET